MNKSQIPVKLPRLFAILVYDILIITALLLSAITLLFISLTLLQIDQPEPNNLYFRLYLLGIIISYYHICWSCIKNGQTIGMRAWHVILDNNNNKFSFKQTVLRITGGILGFFAFGLGYLVLYFNRQNKTLADILSHSQYKNIK